MIGGRVCSLRCFQRAHRVDVPAVTVRSVVVDEIYASLHGMIEADEA